LGWVESVFAGWLHTPKEIPYLGVTIIAPLLVEEPMPEVVTIESTQPCVERQF